jgi:methylmalonyl-CoA mutase N-terminal domain/subunit
VLGGTQSLHTNSMDEALALPSEQAVTVALRTQQIIAHESGVANTVDPLGGAYALEARTDRLEQQAYRYFDQIGALGGVLPAIETGFMQQEIADAAYRYQREIDEGESIIVGVNAFRSGEPVHIPLLKVDPRGYGRHLGRLAEVRADRDSRAVGQALDGLRSAAQGTENTMPYILDAVRLYATLQEVMDVFREVFGLYREPAII